VQEIAAILYQNTSPEQLTTLEEIEITVRQQILTHVSPEIGNFLFAQLQAQGQAEVDKSKVVSDNSI
jgi:hypothetical protein